MRYAIKPFEASSKTHNCVEVSVRYDKGVGGALCSLQTGMTTANADPGFMGWSFIIFGSPSARVTVEGGWRTNNKKRLAAATDMVHSQIKARQGHVYEALNKLLLANGSELLPTDGEMVAVAEADADAKGGDIDMIRPADRVVG